MEGYKMLKETTGKTIKYLREKNDLTREDLCQMIRLGGNSRTEDVQRLYKVENDKMELDDSVIETLAQLFDVKVDDIKDKEEWITVEKAAKIANCSSSTIYNKRREGKIKSKKINGILRFLKGDVENIKVFNSNAKEKQKNKRKDKSKNYYSARDISEKINIKFGYASNLLSEFKRKNKDKTGKKIQESGSPMNILYRKYYNDFIDFMPKKYHKFKEETNGVEKELNFSIEKQQESIDKHRKDKVLELRETIKSQSAKIRELNNKVEELEKYHNKAEMKFEFFSDRITDLENLVDVMNENIDKTEKVEEEKGFFGRIFS